MHVSCTIRRYNGMKTVKKSHRSSSHQAKRRENRLSSSTRSNRGSLIGLIVFVAHFFAIQSASPKSASHINQMRLRVLPGYGNSRPEAKICPI
ncbi:hypothetical protein V3C99_005906 [Haemonchus contortus]